MWFVCVSQWLHIHCGDSPVWLFQESPSPHTPHTTMVHISIGTGGRGGIGAMTPQISGYGYTEVTYVYIGGKWACHTCTCM